MNTQSSDKRQKVPYSKPKVAQIGSIKQVVRTNTTGAAGDKIAPAEQCSVFVPSPTEGFPNGFFIPGCKAS